MSPDADPYVYAGTEVLRNQKSLTSLDALNRFERLATAQRLEESLPSVSLTADGYRALHHHVFQDVYDWAGQYRSVAIAKGDLFALPPYIEGEMQRRFALIHRENDLKGFSAERFSNRAAEHVCEINAVHPFREGNGRTQRLFLKVLARQAGHDLRINKLDAGLWMRGSVESFRHQDYGPMAACIRGALISQERSRAKSISKSKDRSRDME